MKTFVFVAGCIFLGLGIIGIFLPLLPTTPFLLLTAWCFYHSSPRAHDWLYRQSYIGPVLKDWEQRRAISPKTKILALSMIIISLVFIWLKPTLLIMKIGLSGILFAVSIFILTRPNQ